MRPEEFFGSADQRSILKRGRALSEILRNDARFSYYGRTVGVASSLDGDLDLVATLAKIQGNSSCITVPANESQSYSLGLSSRGLTPLVYQKWEGSKTTLAAAREVVSAIPFPDDITLVWVSRETSGGLLQAAADMALNCGVLPTCGAALRGELQPAVSCMAVDRSGNVFSIAAASAIAHPEHATLSGQAWWGMLATNPSMRGRKLALVLGAHAILEMEAKFGFQEFMTGVEVGNTPSEAVCSKMGLAPRGMTIVTCTDPEASRDGRLTK